MRTRAFGRCRKRPRSARESAKRTLCSAGKVVGAAKSAREEHKKGGDDMGQKDDVLTDDLVKNVICNFR